MSDKKSKKSGKKQRAARAGWGFPHETPKAHFFVGGSALCGDADGFSGPYDASMQPTKDDCARCRRLIDAVVRVSKAA